MNYSTDSRKNPWMRSSVPLLKGMAVAVLLNAAGGCWNETPATDVPRPSVPGPNEPSVPVEREGDTHSDGTTAQGDWRQIPVGGPPRKRIARRGPFRMNFGRSVVLGGTSKSPSGESLRILVKGSSAENQRGQSGSIWEFEIPSGRMTRRFEGKNWSTAMGGAMLPIVRDGAVESILLGDWGTSKLYALRPETEDVRVIANEDNEGQYGYVLASVGDLDGDGTPDIAVGSPTGRTGEERFGFVQCISGREWARSVGQLNGSEYGSFGKSIAWVLDRRGEASGNGKPLDPCRQCTGGVGLVVSAPEEERPGKGRCGAVYLAWCIHGGAPLRIEGESGDARFGTALVNVGDIDGDKVEDLAIGAPRCGEGVLRGSGEVVVLSGATRKVLWRLRGSEADEEIGSSLAVWGGGKKDGKGVIAMGSPGHGDGRGRVLLVRCADGSVFAELFGLESDYGFGSSVHIVQADGIGSYLIIVVNDTVLDGRARGGVLRVYEVSGDAPVEVCAIADPQSE